jgi:hypothetical protein
MKSSDIICLFEDPSRSRRRPSAFVVSTLVHSGALAMLSYGILYNPPINDRIVTQRYTVRHLDLHAEELHNGGSGEDGLAYPGPVLSAKTQFTKEQPKAQSAAVRQIPPGVAGLQTLVQPEFHSHLSLSEETPVPTIVIWTPELASSKEIVAPLPEKPTAADVKPSLEAPNEELNLKDAAVAATDLKPRVWAIPPGTTSPVAFHALALLQLAPATISNSADQPTPTAVLSLSDIRMPEGSVTLPPVNETHTSVSSATPVQGQTKGLPAKSKDGRAKSDGTGAAPGTGSFGAMQDRSANSAKPSGANADAAGTDSGSAGQDDTYHITLPKGGQFGVVVVGTSLADEYPETLEVWNDRVAYTAYLHVGLSKNWILQYSLVRSAESAAAGTVARLEAPWPYDIVRPNLVSRDLNADALMVHGILNHTGRFEALTIAFPAQYVRAAFVLHALHQWQFRPARQNGKAVDVEVLLIIPDELD